MTHLGKLYPHIWDRPHYSWKPLPTHLCVPYICISVILFTILKDTFHHRVFSMLISDGSLFTSEGPQYTTEIPLLHGQNHFSHLRLSFCTPNGDKSTHLIEPIQQTLEKPSLPTHLRVTFLHISENPQHSYQTPLLHKRGPSIQTTETCTTHIIYQSLKNSESSCQILHTASLHYFCYSEDSVTHS